MFNGHVDTINAATGKSERPCLVTVRTTRDAFLDRDFARVDPEARLLDLSASLSKSPAELVPVRPVLEFNMVDPRLVEEAEMGLETRIRVSVMVGGWSSGTRSSSASSPRASAFFVMHQMSDSIVTTARLSGLANHGRWLLRSPCEVIGRIGWNRENAGALRRHLVDRGSVALPAATGL